MVARQVTFFWGHEYIWFAFIRGPLPHEINETTIPQLLLMIDNTSVKKGRCVTSTFGVIRLYGSRLSGGPPPYETNEIHQSTMTII